MNTLPLGATVVVNDHGHLDADVRPHINEVGEVVEVFKDGRYQVKTEKGVVTVAKRNLTRLVIAKFPSKASNAHPISGGVVQVYEDQFLRTV